MPVPNETIEVTLSLESFMKNAPHIRPAFKDWQHRLRKGEQLPRGKYFKEKTPGKPLVVQDEFWLAHADFLRRDNDE